MVRVWGRRNSFNVQKVLWLVGELGIEYEHVPAGGSFGRLDEPGFRVLNPHGRVPVLEDGGLAVWESHAILRYLAASHGQGTFWSDDAAERSGVDAWMDWAQTALLPELLNGIFWGYFRTPAARRDAAAVVRSVRRCAGHYRRLQQRPAYREHVMVSFEDLRGRLDY